MTQFDHILLYITKYNYILYFINIIKYNYHYYIPASLGTAPGSEHMHLICELNDRKTEIENGIFKAKPAIDQPSHS